MPQNGYNMAKTMREVGYTEQSSRAGSLYASLRKKVEKWYNPDKVKEDILKAEKDFAKSSDNSNRARMIELRAKIAIPRVDSPAIQVNLFDKYASDLPPLPVEQPVDKSISIDVPIDSNTDNKLT